MIPHIKKIKVVLFLLYAIVCIDPYTPYVYSAESNFHKWFFVQNNLNNFAEFLALNDLVLNSKKHGFNGVVLSSKFDLLDIETTDYISRLKVLKRLCDDQQIDLVPCIFSIGYANALLAHDPNMAEGFPVTNVDLKVQGREALPKNTESTFYCDFEAGRSCDLLLENPGQVTFFDNQISHSGSSSLRLENFRYNKHGNARIVAHLSLKSFSSYIVTFWYRAADNFNSTLKAQIYTPKGNCVTWREYDRPSARWQKAVFEFNSLGDKNLLLYLGVWNGRTGRVWIDDLTIKPQNDLAGMIRRDGAPLEITNLSTGQKYSETTDFVVSEKLPHSGRYFIQIPLQSHIQEGDVLHISFYRKYEMGNEQTSACMANPAIYKIWERQIRTIEEVIKPKAYFLSMDEIRQGGYCGLCRDRNMAELLGECVTKQVGLIKKYNPNAEIYIWSDMLDPNVNAVNDYFMVRGNFYGSWRNISKSIHPVIWVFDNRDRSLVHFKTNGFMPLISVCVDGDQAETIIKSWISSIKNTHDLMGVMYTTWEHDYSQLEFFSRVFFD